tara:strand:- start:2812 stop:3720 length:909 start_codon:yes stop_codon:yes gene_type:complete
MEIKTVIDRMDAEKFIDTVNDPLFVGGLAKAIEMTRARNYETRFGMYRSHSEDETFFDETIEVGDVHSVGGRYRHGDLEAEFEVENGKCPMYPFSSKGEMSDVKEFLRVNEKRKEYQKRLNQFLESKEEEFHVDFPNLPKIRDRMYSHHFDDVYNLVNVHTHPLFTSRILRPISFVAPSEADLKCLWKLRREALEEKTEEDWGYNRPKIIAPVFMMIAGTDLREDITDKGYQLGLAISHKDETTNRDVKESGNQFESLWKVPRDRGFATNDAYSYTLGTFDPKKMRVEFEPSNIDAMIQSVE